MIRKLECSRLGRLLQQLAAMVLAAAMLFGLLPSAGAYNAAASDLTGNMTGLEMNMAVAEEGMVLLQNREVNGKKALPLDDGESIAIFGINQVDYIWGGGGSGNFAADALDQNINYVSLYDGMQKYAHTKNGKSVTIYSGLYDIYKQYYDDSWKTNISYAYGTKQGAVIKAKGEKALTDAQVGAAADAADTAIITIGRPAGEDGDRADRAGDFQLHANEKKTIEQVVAKKEAGEFKKVIVVLNVTGVIETDVFAAENSGVDAVLLAYLPGVVGGDAMAEVLMGDAYPSGKTVDTWAKKYSDYPSSRNFGNQTATNYEEDIFVGYRYFETIPNASTRVNYPFGYGLSYTDFEISNTSVTVTGSGRERTVTATATVKNTGSRPGKEVVQVYCGAPEGRLTQPKRELVAFKKTKELAASESETVTMTFKFDELASYDDLGKTGNEAAFVLEAGDYKFYIGNNVRDAAAPGTGGTYNLQSLEKVEQLSHRLVPDTSKLTRRLKSDGSYETLTKTTAAAQKKEEGEDKYTGTIPEVEDPFITFPDVVQAFNEDSSQKEDLLTTFVSRMSDDELIKLTGATDPVGGKGHRTGLAGLSVYGLPVIGTSNGPAGIQYNGSKHTYETTTTFYPCATMQASTWNVELVQQLGAAMADEARHYEMSLWQAPGMNIHRNPLCGRNFEYFAEDPYLTGKMGSAITTGVQSRKFASQLKHFACNNQEYGRWGNDSRVSERALREIYLKGYEIAVKESDPWSIMSSYNRINGTYASANHDLLTGILRDEWGFTGFVMTDFNTSARHEDEIIAGGDVKAPAASPKPSDVLNALKNGKIKRWMLERSAERVIRFALRTEDAQIALKNPFKYSIGLDIKSDKVEVKGSDRVLLLGDITWGDLKNAIVDHYNQTYQLVDASGNAITDEEAKVTVNMKLAVTAEDGKTKRDYIFTTSSLALNKAAKASGQENNDHGPEKAVDGSTDTYWSSYGASGGNYGHWLEVDLGGDYHLTQIDTTLFNKQGQDRKYTYEIWTKKGYNSSWGSGGKDRSLTNQGYTKIASATDVSAKNPSAQALSGEGKEDIIGRYIVVKVTGGKDNATCSAVTELDVHGWRLTSNVYQIDDENKTISIVFGDDAGSITKGLVLSNLKLEGSGSVAFAEGGSTWATTDDKIEVTDKNGNVTQYSIVNVEEGVTNLALRKPARATYSESGTDPSLAVDGDPNSRWSGYEDRSSTGNRFDNWFEVDLGAVYSLTKISNLFYKPDSRAYTYEIWGKKDAISDADWKNPSTSMSLAGYTKLYEGTSTTQSAPHVVTTFNANPPVARYILIKVKSITGGGLAPTIHELEVYGKAYVESVPVTAINVLKDGVNINNQTIKVYTNEGDPDHSVTLSSQVLPTNATNKTVNITRQEGAQGKIELVRHGDGTATITAIRGETNVGEVTIEVASASNPEVTATFKVHVIRKLENPVSISINGVNNPNVAPKYGDTLEADINQLKMTDAGKAALKYQWYRNEKPISGATNKTYTLEENDIGAVMSVDVIADPATYYEGTRTAERSQEVVKADAPIIPGNKIYGVQPTTADNEDGKIVGFDEDYVYEYTVRDENDWTTVSGTEVTDLTPGYYQVRIKETDTHEAGEPINVTILEYGVEGYRVIRDPDMVNGNVKREPSQAEAGTEITLTVEPARGYRLEALRVIDGNDDEVEVTEESENIYTFELPNSDVTVYADFEKLRYTIYHELEHLTCSRGSNDSHDVEFGDTAAITLVPDEGYRLPDGADIKIVNANDVEITGWTIDENGTITITGGVTSDLTITAAGVPQTCTVNFTVTNGVNASDAPRSVGYGEAYTATLHVATGYTLPQNITITMDGEPFADFTYDSVTGVISIGEGILTGRLLVITAVGVGTGPITPVEPDTPDTPDTPDIPVEPSRPDRRPAKPSSSRDDDDDGKDDKTTDNTAGVTPPVAPETPAAPSNPQQPASFDDVKGSDWFNNAVSYVSQNGLMSGNNGRFAPDDRLTRGMMAQILYNMEGASGSGSRSFPDVTVNDWFAASVGWAATQGYMGGYSNGAFGPNDPITREQVAAILYRYAMAKGLAVGSASLDAFIDSASTSDWARDAVSWAVSAGILSGKSGNRLDPTGTASRAEIAQILMNFSQNIAK